MVGKKGKKKEAIVKFGEGQIQRAELQGDTGGRKGNSVLFGARGGAATPVAALGPDEERPFAELEGIQPSDGKERCHREGEGAWPRKSRFLLMQTLTTHISISGSISILSCHIPSP